MVVTIGTKGRQKFHRGACQRRTFPLMRVPDQLAAVFALQLPQPEGNVSGGLRRRAILDLQGLPLPCFLSIVLLLSSFHVVFLYRNTVFP